MVLFKVSAALHLLHRNGTNLRLFTVIDVMVRLRHAIRALRKLEQFCMPHYALNKIVIFSRPAPAC